jgi:hypothetical protein
VIRRGEALEGEAVKETLHTNSLDVEEYLGCDVKPLAFEDLMATIEMGEEDIVVDANVMEARSRKLKDVPKEARDVLHERIQQEAKVGYAKHPKKVEFASKKPTRKERLELMEVDEPENTSNDLTRNGNPMEPQIDEKLPSSSKGKGKVIAEQKEGNQGLVPACSAGELLMMNFSEARLDITVAQYRTSKEGSEFLAKGMNSHITQRSSSTLPTVQSSLMLPSAQPSSTLPAVQPPSALPAAQAEYIWPYWKGLDGISKLDRTQRLLMVLELENG